jgi:hypothetical protein
MGLRPNAIADLNSAILKEFSFKAFYRVNGMRQRWTLDSVVSALHSIADFLVNAS